MTRPLWEIEANRPQRVNTITLGVLPAGFAETHPSEAQPTEPLLGLISGADDFAILTPLTEKEARVRRKRVCRAGSI